jgi:hypothetical protein
LLTLVNNLSNTEALCRGGFANGAWRRSAIREGPLTDDANGGCRSGTTAEAVFGVKSALAQNPTIP